ncbi:MAG: A24 family peptidase [archaeon]
MIIEILLLASALIGTAAGGWIDLKTTEIPDIVPLSMVIAGVVLHTANGLTGGSFEGLVSAIIVGAIYLALGYVLYYTGQWGEADVLLLAATGFLIPQPLSFFNIITTKEIYPILFLMNTFIVGGIYSLIYSGILASRNPEIFTNYWKDIAKNRNKIMTAIAAFTIAMLGLTYILSYMADIYITTSLIATQLIFFVPMAAALILMYRFALVLDNTAFKRKIPASRLREGDVLAENVELKGTTLSGKLFIGLTVDQIRLIKKERRHVSIKEGIRYGPTFFLSILFTWFFGNSIIMIFGWI